MPNNAAARLRTRLRKKSALIQRAEVGGVKLEDVRREENVLLKAEGTGLVVNWDENPYASS